MDPDDVFPASTVEWLAMRQDNCLGLIDVFHGDRSQQILLDESLEAKVNSRIPLASTALDVRIDGFRFWRILEVHTVLVGIRVEDDVVFV